MLGRNSYEPEELENARAAVKKQLESQGLEMTPKDQLTPEALGARQKAEIAKWWPIIKAADIKVD